MTESEAEQIKKLVHIHTDPSQLFELVEILGIGSYGQVYKGRQKQTGEIVAIKVLPVLDTDIQTSIKEMEILGKCDSPHIVKYYGAYYLTGNLWLVMEYCEGGSVTDIFRATGVVLKEREIACVLKQVLEGLKYMHQNKMIHRDVKAANLLITKSGCVKIADFGVSAQLMSTLGNQDSMIGTPFWMSPEVITKSKYNQKADIWSIGITSIEMAEGQPPLSSMHPFRAMLMIKRNPPSGFTKPEDYSPEFNDFVKQCLTINPEERPYAFQLLDHPFITGSGSSQPLIDLYVRSVDELKVFRANVGNRKPPKKPQLEQVEDFEFNDTGTMIVHKDGPTSEMGFEGNLLEGEPNEVQLPPEDTGTIIYHGTSDIEDGSMKINKGVENNGNEENTEFGMYMQMFKKVNSQYDIEQLKSKLSSLNENLTSSQRYADMSIFASRKIELEKEQQDEIERIKAKYKSKISSIMKIIETKSMIQEVKKELEQLGYQVPEAPKKKKYQSENKLTTSTSNSSKSKYMIPKLEIEKKTKRYPDYSKELASGNRAQVNKDQAARIVINDKYKLGTNGKVRRKNQASPKSKLSSKGSSKSRKIKGIEYISGPQSDRYINNNKNVLANSSRGGIPSGNQNQQYSTRYGNVKYERTATEPSERPSKYNGNIGRISSNKYFKSSKGGLYKSKNENQDNSFKMRQSNKKENQKISNAQNNLSKSLSINYY